MRSKTHSSSLLLGGIASLTLTLSSAAQISRAARVETEPVEVTATPVDAAPTIVEDRFIVLFEKRAYDLVELRAAILAGKSAADVDRIVAGLEAKTAKERASFVAAVAKLGGRVTDNFWIINASAVELPKAKLATLAALPNVAEVEPERLWPSHLRTATNASNHNSDGANVLKNTSNQLITGTGLSVAVLDTGSDAAHASSGRPHRMYFRNGNVADRTGGGIGGSRLRAALGYWSGRRDVEDYAGHGTMVASCAASGGWGSVYADRGVAPDAWIVGVKITYSTSGGASSAAIIWGWQTALGSRSTYNIKVANNSFSGSNGVTSSIQRALDSAAYNGDILITTSSGNSGTRVTSTQASFNGLSVGSANKNTRSVSSFSSRGTMSTGKVVPDIYAVGASVYMALRNAENSSARASGTSFSSPITAGAAALVRQANAKLTALETKAILLQSTLAQTNGSGKGAGYMRADNAARAAVATNVRTSRLSSAKKTETFFFTAQIGTWQAVAVTWFRKIFTTSSNDNLDLTVYNPSGTAIGTSARNHANSYEYVGFRAPATGTYRVVVTGSLVNSFVDYAIAGLGAAIPPKPPTLTAIKPAKVSLFPAQIVTLTGTNLTTIDKVHVGTQIVPPKSTSATSLTFVVPSVTALGAVQVKVSNPAGTSGGLTMTYEGKHPPAISGSAFLLGGFTEIDDFWSDKGWIGIYYASDKNTASKAAGVVDLGIGANFTSLFTAGVFVGDAIGHGKLKWSVPTGFKGWTVYFQAIAFDAFNFKLPFESSNVLTRKVVF